MEVDKIKNLNSSTLTLPRETKTIISSQYNIKETSDENKEKYQWGDYWLIKYQILQTKIAMIVGQKVKRITEGGLFVSEMVKSPSWIKVKSHVADQ